MFPVPTHSAALAILAHNMYLEDAPMWPKSYHSTGPQEHMVRHRTYQKHINQCISVCNWCPITATLQCQLDNQCHSTLAAMHGKILMRENFGK